MSDSEFEEPEELKKLTAGRSPTREMREQHEIENHSVYRDWRDVCIGSRGGHATSEKGEEEAGRGGAGRSSHLLGLLFHERGRAVDADARGQVLEV